MHPGKIKTMQNKKESKRFIIPILTLTITSIIFVSITITYLNINVLKQNMVKDIEDHKKEYLQKNKNSIYEKVQFANNTIKFNITRIDNRLRELLTERMHNTLKIVDFMYNEHKNELPDAKIKLTISRYLDTISKKEPHSFYFSHEYTTGAIPEIALTRQNREELKNGKVIFYKKYNTQNESHKDTYKTLNAVAIFEPLNIIIGTGEHFHVIEEQVKAIILDRFNNIAKDPKIYLFFLELHDINGGDKFATMILNPNRPDLVGRVLSDSYKDPKGKELRKEFLQELRRDGESYVTYWYKKPHMSEAKPNMSYFHLNTDWNWIIASGFYYTDLDEQIASMEQSFKAYTADIIYDSILLILLLSIIVISIAVLVSLNIDRTIKRYTDKITENKLELELLASTDPMTKLYNRRFFTETSESILKLAKRNQTDSSIIILDIDKFKNVNDLYGHKVGDDAIIALASLLQDHGRESDIVSRWGGEEFVILLPYTNAEGAVLISEKIRKSVESLVIDLDDSQQLTLTISIGVSQVINETEKNIEIAIKRADVALYKAKESGRNKVCLN